MNYIFVPYFYVVTANQLAAGASGQVPLLLDQDADFELHSLTAYTDQDGAANYRPNNFSVQITDKNNSRIWSNVRLAQVTMVPSYDLRRPVLLSARSNLSFDFLNLTAGTALYPTITLHGFKVLHTVGAAQPV